jgi:hypothetical protein
MDLQAQDRAHRIGQTRPVLVFRLVSAHTIETKILQKAGNKRKLEAMVISQGKFGRMVDENGRVLLGKGTKKAEKKGEAMADMARAMLDLEGEEINVASKDDMIIRCVDRLGLLTLVTPTWTFYSTAARKPWPVKSVGLLVWAPREPTRRPRYSRAKRRRSKCLCPPRMMRRMVSLQCLTGMNSN